MSLRRPPARFCHNRTNSRPCFGARSRPRAFGKLAIKRDPDIGIDFRRLRQLTLAHSYVVSPKSRAAPKTENLAKTVSYSTRFLPILPENWDPELPHNFSYFLVP